MPNNDVKPESSEAKLQHAGTQSTGANLSGEIFGDPHDFLRTLRDHYSQLAHGHRGLTKPDLELEASTNKDEKVRAAAHIAAEHFTDLSDQYFHYQGYAHDSKGQLISKDDLQFADDMNSHNTTSYALMSAAEDVGAGVGTLAAGAFIGWNGGLFLGLSQFTVGSSATLGIAASAAETAGVVASAAIGFGLMAAGAAVGIGGLGYYTYEAFKERGRANALADRDSQMFRSWLDKQSS